jgi:preprotein translocase subunit SecA
VATILSGLLQVNETLFPCKLSKETTSLAEEAVESAAKIWGEKSLSELEAEDRLSYACEKGPIEDEVMTQLRNVVQSIITEFRSFTDEEKKKV